MKKLLSLMAAIAAYMSVLAQDWSTIQEPPSITSVNHAARMAGEILDAAGLQSNFQIAEANVPNAMAVVQQGRRFILYNPGFIERLTIATGTRWAAVSVLAHEIGHHLYPGSENAGQKLLSTELEADEFSGYVLKKMGASLEEAQAAMKVLGTKYATDTHPAAADRMASIESGWIAAGGVSNNSDTYGEEDTDDVISASTILREKLLPSAAIAAVLKFNSDPKNEYYITTKLNVVRFNGREVEVIGKVTRSGSADYPYIIYDETGYRLYVSQTGSIYNSGGTILGSLELKQTS